MSHSPPELVELIMHVAKKLYEKDCLFVEVHESQSHVVLLVTCYLTKSTV